MARLTQFGVNEFYHIFNRGVDKRNIFLSKADYRRFLYLLYLANGEQPVRIHNDKRKQEEIFTKELRDDRLVDIGAFCLMPNHFHLLLRERKEGGISNFIHKVSTGYSMYFNKKNERTGALFQGRFKAVHVTTDQYLKYLYAYIHLNPVSLIEPHWKQVGIQDFFAIRNHLHSYRYSSFLDLIGEERPESAILDRKEFPRYFDKLEADTFSLASELESWLKLSQKEIRDQEFEES